MAYRGSLQPWRLPIFARVKKSGRNQYLELVENRKEKGKVKQRIIATVGRMDQLK